MNRIDRDEPSIGSVDMSQVEFRRPRRPSMRTDDDHRHAGLWWRIALGIFVGMLAHSIVTGLYVRWELYTGLQAMGTVFEDLEKEANAAPAAGSKPRARPVTPARTRPASIRPLAADERCVGGKRFQRVENGWAQVLEPCRS